MCSGRGSNLRAILQAIQEKRLDAHASIVICNDPSAKAIHVAKEFGVRAVCIPSHGLSRGDHEKQVFEVLETENLDFIVLAGYMRILSEVFLAHFKDERGFFRVVNIHPSLLPAFPGKSAYEEAFNYGVKLSGITIHLVDEKVDHGYILAQEAFPRYDDDTLATFKDRGLAVEHRLFPETLQTLAKGKLSFLSRELVQP
jgi:phosphoribosylglycinamide formyltransferase-1